MRLVSFQHQGATSYGVVSAAGDGIVDLGARLGPGLRSVRELLEAGARRGEAVREAAGGAADLALDMVELLPPVPDSRKIFAIGLNYDEHRAEGNRPKADFPTVFTRFPDSQVGHGQPIVKPDVSDKVDYEGELAVVIGAGGFHIPEGAAMEHVAGYAAYNDVSVRDWQRHTSQFIPGKNFFHAGAFGPWLVTADELPDIPSQTLTTRLNGEVMQHASIGDLLFPIPRLVAYLSAFTPLSPGDVIATGTPAGVGVYRDPPVFLLPGDVVEVEISGVGTLRNPVAAEKDA
jgi:2-keto-4-pentenoate hydratase/2-oxohepta-3-ene-1,7-dioic acid hydratase in catechol pathway